MKVVYEPPIMDRIRDAKATALREGRTIDHISLTECEWNELMAWRGEQLLCPQPSDLLNLECEVLGITCWLQPEIRCPA